MGIDPGLGGGCAVLSHRGTLIALFRFDSTESEIATNFRDVLDLVGVQYRGRVTACIERVGAMPGQGVTSMFSFGKIYGFLRGMLTAFRIPFYEVQPLKWQQALGCRTKGDKNISKAKAQQLFPSQKITHKTADALLIAEFARRQELHGF